MVNNWKCKIYFITALSLNGSGIIKYIYILEWPSISCVFQLSDVPVLYLYCDTVKTIIPLLSGDRQPANLDRLTEACIKTLTRSHTETEVRIIIPL